MATLDSTECWNCKAGPQYRITSSLTGNQYCTRCGACVDSPEKERIESVVETLFRQINGHSSMEG